MMIFKIHRISFTVLGASLVFAAGACSDQKTSVPAANTRSNTQAASPPAAPEAQRSGGRAPAQNLTVADIAKIKWLEGSYRGTGADKPFFNRYRFNGTTLNVQGFEDEAMTKQNDSAVYELKDGMFANPGGDTRFAASEITDDHIQFVSLNGKTAAYRLERLPDGSVRATLNWTGPEGSPETKTYDMERMK